MKAIKRSRLIILSISILLTLLFPMFIKAAPLAQVPTPESRAQALLDQLTPEERVGQLFLINFDGTELIEDNPLHTLITKNHIGGVILKQENDNFNDQDGLLNSIWALNQSIQNADWLGSQEALFEPFTNDSFLPTFIPLFIGISQDGGGMPDDQILSGLTSQPSSMAIGATWNPELSYQTGKLLGEELEILGFNLLLGPSLNVLENPRPENAGDLGTRSFGGNPYWVGQMGAAYITGIHEGSDNRILVVSDNFPGLSSPDRPPSEEIPTVLKSQEQLLELELIPFFAVTGDAPTSESTLDALLLANAKYQGFQGEIGPLTSPISLDAQAFTQLMALPQFVEWRDGGGLIITDELGSRAIRRFEDTTEQVFNYRLIAMTAFLTGNDLLNLGDFSSTEDPDSLTTIRRTLDIFALKYREDVLFQQRVDAAVLRILIKKFELYESFHPGNILTSEEDLLLIGQQEEISIEIASQAMTLLSPTAENLNNVIPNIPGLNEQIVVFTDTYPVQQCSTCLEKESIPVNAFQEETTRLYGPLGGGQIRTQNISSYSFEDLISLLDNQVNQDLSDDLLTAEWVIFLTQDIDPNRPQSTALKRFLSERPDLIQDKKNIVFGLDAPYYLDATDISNITAYFGLYSSQPEFVDIAVRLLFKELSASSASPVSVAGIGYDLNEATSPDPNQVFSLSIVPVEIENVNDVDATPEVEEEEISHNYQIGDTILLETGLIFDQNGNSISDNTPVSFVLTSLGSENNSKEIPAPSLDGKARISLVLDIPGSIDIQANTGLIPSFSEVLRVEVTAPENGQVPVPSETETAVGDTPEPTETTPISGQNSFEETLSQGKIAEGHWLLLIMVNLFIALFAYQLGATTGRVRWGIRWALTAMIGGLLIITFLSFGMNGSAEFIVEFKLWGVVILTVIGALLGWGFGWLWYLFASPKK
ncbi:MAG: hypothetical protein HON98_01245 [Chloroflexi bacterium]|jgi:beta-N-acetylhexosaminidase|nr:hypothetical protein [Chloroflexota bacterium]MBT3668840.1 hypothetical protein [Chloroflexota bacterium]MBT4004230.1 hypothetical protein [Chloroflexota bacterium]MBT4306554.1 hypothetical protein [Chloroflexota bacterium]MBT4533938.1 hypothetical protein [Chloroflexota bacterium]